MTKRERSARNASKFQDTDWEEVDRLIKLDWSPEQIAGRIKKEGGLAISHESVYRHIYSDKSHGGELWKHLRCQKKRRKRYGSGKNRRGIIPGRVGIEKRTSRAQEKRSRLGDWEGDTVIGKSHKGAIVTLAERKSRLLRARKLICQRSS